MASENAKAKVKHIPEIIITIFEVSEGSLCFWRRPVSILPPSEFPAEIFPMGSAWADFQTRMDRRMPIIKPPTVLAMWFSRVPLTHIFSWKVRRSGVERSSDFKQQGQNAFLRRMVHGLKSREKKLEIF